MSNLPLNRYLHQYLFTEDIPLLPELRHMILEYWVPSAFLSYLDRWSCTAYFDTNGHPYWYDTSNKGVAIAYIEPQYSSPGINYTLSDESFEVRCANWFIDYDPHQLLYGECEYFTNRSNLFLNIAIMISHSKGENLQDRQDIGQYFIPIEFLDSYSVEKSSNTNDEYIKLNILKVIKAHLQRADVILSNNNDASREDMKQYITECKELFELLEANRDEYRNRNHLHLL